MNKEKAIEMLIGAGADSTATALGLVREAAVSEICVEAAANWPSWLEVVQDYMAEEIDYAEAVNLFNERGFEASASVLFTVGDETWTEIEAEVKDDVMVAGIIIALGISYLALEEEEDDE